MWLFGYVHWMWIFIFGSPSTPSSPCGCWIDKYLWEFHWVVNITYRNTLTLKGLSPMGVWAQLCYINHSFFYYNSMWDFTHTCTLNNFLPHVSLLIIIQSGTSLTHVHPQTYHLCVSLCLIRENLAPLPYEIFSFTHVHHPWAFTCQPICLLCIGTSHF